MIDMRRQDLVRALPMARRFARALSGDQAAGDRLVAAAIPELLAEAFSDTPARQALYAHIIARYRDNATVAEGTLGFDQRVLLLLTGLEELTLPTAAAILDIPVETAELEIAKARTGLRSVAETSVLIIEDEPVIAMDIQDLVEQCGHNVVGIAQTEAEAVALAEEHKPGLILADINLGHGNDGMQAVGRIMKTHRAPVIFVTAYPERLLTGAAEEPPFVITKPFEPMMLAITTYQAVTGGIPTI
jgi:CheY-like chemotaxis protein